MTELSQVELSQVELGHATQKDLDAIHDYYWLIFEQKPTSVPGFLTITIINYGSNMFIASNTAQRHSELNCWDLLENKRKKMRKNMNIYVTEARCKVVTDADGDDKFVYSYSQPCLHCTKTFKHYAKYVGAQANSSILFRWSVGGESKEPLFTKFKDIREINDSTISTGWALKHNKL
tara:strand:- start:753 stop:1283 length:531 start_codon:yes stop_codon:yes gene_type:complete